MRIDDIFPLVTRSVADGNLPGAALGLLENGEISVRMAGVAQIGTDEPIRLGTLFDLASLTKVVFTTEAILALVAQGQISLDDPLSKAIPDLRQYDVANALERRLTFRQCLSHATHLPAVEPLYTLGLNAATLRAHILQRAWTPGEPVYSDINFMLLGIAIERLSGRALHEQPLPEGFTFQPAPVECAATEVCTWRGRLLRGEVHDENAAAFGGAAGHAGLFGSAEALLRFAGRLLARGDSPIRERQSETRSIGWQTKHTGWSGGALCSGGTIGHTGFTGTGLWIDFAANRAWTLLSNRVHPTRHRETGINHLRQAVGEAISSG